MNRLLCIVAAGVLVLGAAATALADIGPKPFPRPFPGPVMPQPVPRPIVREATSSMVIEIREDAKTPRLQVPRTLLGTFRVSLDEEQTPNTAVASAEPPAEVKPAPSRGQTIAAGLCLSMALAFGGMWMVRHRGQMGSRGMTLCVAAVVLLGIGAASAWAGLSRPQSGEGKPVQQVAEVGVIPLAQPAKPNAKPVGNPPLVLPVGEKITVEIVDRGNQIKLIVNKEYFVKQIEKSKVMESGTAKE